MNALPRGIDNESEPEEVPAQDHPVLELRPVCQAHLDIEVPGRDLDGRPDNGAQRLVASSVPYPPPLVDRPLEPLTALLELEPYPALGN